METYMHPDLQKRIEDRRRREAMQVAADWRLLRRPKAERWGWLKQRGCWLLCQLGRLLVWSGRRLQEAGSLQPT